jgi:hypothetical protein
MEDEGFVDDSFIEATAWEYVSLHGKESVSLLLRLAAAADRAGDGLSARPGARLQRRPHV